MNYTAILSAATTKRLDRFDELAANPYDPRWSKKLVNAEGLRSSRVGDWRIIHIVSEASKIIYVTAVRPRGEAYRRL